MIADTNRRRANELSPSSGMKTIPTISAEAAHEIRFLRGLISGLR